MILISHLHGFLHEVYCHVTAIGINLGVRILANHKTVWQSLEYSSLIRESDAHSEIGSLVDLLFENLQWISGCFAFISLLGTDDTCPNDLFDICSHLLKYTGNLQPISHVY